jgi:putative zinc finger/helix-turn-helix YgiT family protein
MNCPNCEASDLHVARVKLAGTVRGEEFSVETSGLRCPNCGFETIEGEDMPEYGRLLADAYRRTHGLLTSDEIRALRKARGMSQAQFAEWLGVGEASIKRWEMGKIQDPRNNDRIVEMTSLPLTATSCGMILLRRSISNVSLAFDKVAEASLLASTQDLAALVDEYTCTIVVNASDFLEHTSVSEHSVIPSFLADHFLKDDHCNA